LCGEHLGPTGRKKVIARRVQWPTEFTVLRW
jgi:hypothetical protein